jgi:hypothetical protein
MQKAADYFNVDYRSILNHLDTELATIKGGKLVLLFSHELTKRFAAEKESLLNNVQKAVNVTVSVWVYKKVNDKLILLNDNKPTYNSRLEASKELKISTKTIRKYLDTRSRACAGPPLATTGGGQGHKEYKGLYFYSVSL